MNEDKLINGDKIRSFIQRNTGYLVAVLVAGVYIATSVLMMDETGKSIEKIICDGAISFFVGMVLTRIFSLQGIMRGGEDPLVKDTLKEHSDQIMIIAPFIDRLDDWCDMQTAMALRRERTKLMAAKTMRYSDYFEPDGVARPFAERACKTRGERKREKVRKKAYYKAVNLEISPLLAASLIGGGEKIDDPFDFGPSISEYESKAMRREGVLKILMACVFGYYTFELIQNFSAAELIWKLFQVGLFCAGGVVQTNRSYLFMLNGYRKRIMLCTGKLREFAAYEENSRNKEVSENEHKQLA